MDNFETAFTIAEKVKDAGGRAFYVGGFVRDTLLGKKPSEIKDIDVEVHGISPETLKSILSSVGNLRETGKSFGIYGINGCDLDIAMPRTEKAAGAGHRDFEIFVDPFIGTYKAAKRRDFTVNALMKDILTGEITDHFNGLGDLKAKTLRHVSSDSFPEDPLRVLRCARFAAKLSFSVSGETIDLCRNISCESLAKERIFSELSRALTESVKPSVFFDVLDSMNQCEKLFPELFALKGIPQPVKYHPEGDAYAHTMAVVDNASDFAKNAINKEGFMFAALCHDFGKAVCTEYESGNFHSIGHETAGLQLAENFLNRVTSEKTLKKYVLNMVKTHMRPNILAASSSSVKATNRLFDESVCPEDLILLALSDIAPAQSLDDCLKKALNEKIKTNYAFLMRRLAAYRDYVSRPCVTGEDLIAAGFKPGKEFSEMLRFSRKLLLSGVPKEEVMKEIMRKKKTDE